MVSTVGDLNRFFGALLAGRLLPREQQRQMWGMGGAIFGSRPRRSSSAVRDREWSRYRTSATFALCKCSALGVTSGMSGGETR
ncbi:hypothetical protein A8924_5687 [Saccharopolyspora erythraea NRRL 2338]|uniref:Uncharacterized protein n=1 Tax=Saccharopolyspora erythraea TaxID=1836 RepID=A0ABN1E225_SACER|nr:hypothetical protein [Saccharopolyspora erythraea]EQD84250.1 hypothetical protein N599_21065 [Saccharopolyspora erythraea D]PFG98182.1 hypothetical protein A8924_5687 [Saccharopolyspora erythraea NRRL 2338]QRK88282.1 hypothetical protein JQX30_26855 [Saccharopolyspora erythraea]